MDDKKAATAVISQWSFDFSIIDRHNKKLFFIFNYHLKNIISEKKLKARKILYYIQYGAKNEEIFQWCLYNKTHKCKKYCRHLNTYKKCSSHLGRNIRSHSLAHVSLSLASLLA